MSIVFVFLRAFLKSAKMFTCCYTLSEPPFSKNTCFYDKNNPPTPQRQASGLRAKGPSDKENTRPMPSPGKYPTCHTRIYHNQELGVATPTCPHDLSKNIQPVIHRFLFVNTYYKLLQIIEMWQQLWTYSNTYWTIIERYYHRLHLPKAIEHACEAKLCQYQASRHTTMPILIVCIIRWPFCLKKCYSKL